MKRAVITIIIRVAIVVVFGIGWILNIINFVKLDFQAPYKAEIIRGIGISAVPIGRILEYLTIKDGQPKVVDIVTEVNN